MTQRVQLATQNCAIRRVLKDWDRFAIRLIAWFPFLRRIPARMIGMGFRPEHVQTRTIKTEDTSGMGRT